MHSYLSEIRKKQEKMTKIYQKSKMCEECHNRWNVRQEMKKSLDFFEKRHKLKLDANVIFNVVVKKISEEFYICFDCEHEFEMKMTKKKKNTIGKLLKQIRNSLNVRELEVSDRESDEGSVSNYGSDASTPNHDKEDEEEEEEENDLKKYHYSSDLETDSDQSKISDK